MAFLLRIYPSRLSFTPYRLGLLRLYWVYFQLDLYNSSLAEEIVLGQQDTVHLELRRSRIAIDRIRHLVWQQSHNVTEMGIMGYISPHHSWSNNRSLGSHLIQA
jgi:hypothetical protein